MRQVRIGDSGKPENKSTFWVRKTERCRLNENGDIVNSSPRLWHTYSEHAAVEDFSIRSQNALKRSHSPRSEVYTFRRIFRQSQTEKREAEP